MSSITHGMDVGETRQLAARLDQHGDALVAAHREVGGSLARAQWLGRDAETFRTEWKRSLGPALTRSANGLDALAGELRRQAAEQEAASQAGGLMFGFGGPLLSGWSDLVERAGALVDQGIDWIGGLAEEGVEWTQNAAGGFVQAQGARISATMAGAERVGAASAVLGDNIFGMFEGDFPTPAEIGASLVLIGGTNIGASANFVTGKDQHFFDDGAPRTGVITDTTPGVAPTSLLETLAGTQRGYDESELVVTAQVGNDGITRFNVSMPGTQAEITSLDGWTGDENGRDWPANLWGIASGTSSGTQAAEAAILQAIEAHTATHPDAVFGGKPEVLLNGHSQSGIMAANMSADPDFTSKVDVVAVTSLGGPVDAADIPSNTPVLSVQHGGPTELGDFVPRLDLGGWLGTPDNITNVPLPAPGGNSPFEIVANHELAGYLDSLQTVEGQQALNDWTAAHPEVDQFYSGDPDQAVRYDVGFGRK